MTICNTRAGAATRIRWSHRSCWIARLFFVERVAPFAQELIDDDAYIARSRRGGVVLIASREQ